MAEYKIGNYTFRTQQEFEQAKKELDFIKRAKEKYNLRDPQIAKRILEKFKPETVIGRRFCDQLREICGDTSDPLDDLIGGNTSTSPVTRTPANQTRSSGNVGGTRSTPNFTYGNNSRNVYVEDDVDDSNMVIKDPAKIEILRRLKKYPNTFECQCLECGYKGPMGVISDGDKKKKRWAWIVTIVLFWLFVPRLYYGFGVTVGGLVLMGIIYWIVSSRLKADVKTLYCPNCEKILHTK